MSQLHRRNFIKLAGMGAIGIAAGAAGTAVAENNGQPMTALDFMTPQEIADVLGYDNSPNANVGPKIQLAIDEAAWTKRELIFPAGYYPIHAPLLFASRFARVRGIGQVTIHRTTGYGPIIKVGHPNPAMRLDALSFENLLLKGHKTGAYHVDNAIEIKNTHRSIFSDLRVRDCVESAFLIDYSHSNEFRSLRCSDNVDELFTVNPAYGIRLINNSTANVFTNPVMERPITNTGIYIENGAANLFNGGCIEAVPYGAALYAAALNNTFVNVDFEQNTACDIEINGGSHNTFSGCVASSTAAHCVRINAGTSNSFHGGQYRQVHLATGTSTKFFGVAMTQAPSGLGQRDIY